ncbi:adenylyl-sulfate kinase, partial [Hansschlegelia beijingensis]
ENIRRVGEVAKLFVEAGTLTICCFISPFEAERELVRSLVGEGEFLEIFVDTPLAVCEARDPKGLYARARAGQIPNFTGVSSPYERPQTPDLLLDTTRHAPEQLAQQVVDLITQKGLIQPS